MKATAPIVVVCGLRDSSVSRVAALLANRPDAFLLPELNLFMASTLGTLQSMFERSQDGLGDGLLRAIAVLKFGHDNQLGIQRAQDWLWRRSDWSAVQLLQELARGAQARQLVLPDINLGWRPNYLRHLDDLQHFQFVHITRHPVHHCRDLSANLAEQGFVSPEWRDFFNNPAGAIDPQIAWYRFHQNIRQRWAQDGRYQHLRLEDLQAAPQQQLTLIGKKFDWPIAAKLTPRNNSYFLRPGCELAPMGMERSCLMAPDLTLELRRDPELLGLADWRDDGIAMTSELVQLARAMGYNNSVSP